MIHKKIEIKARGMEAVGNLYTYFLDSSIEMRPNEKRPVILMCPGGGYEMTSDREAEPMAMQFLAMGYHVAVLRYSVCPVRYPAALLQVAESVLYLKEHADEYHIDPEKIVVQGCSAGGHLAANYGIAWNSPFLTKLMGIENDPERLRVAGLLLCYPVITSGEKAHEESFRNLLGEQYEEKKEELSLENQVTPDTPPTFLWHTATDETVPVENSLYFSKPVCSRVFPQNYIFTQWEDTDFLLQMKKPAVPTESVCKRNVRAGLVWHRPGWKKYS